MTKRKQSKPEEPFISEHGFELLALVSIIGFCIFLHYFFTWSEKKMLKDILGPYHYERQYGRYEK
jgi:hypothetical protein